MKTDRKTVNATGNNDLYNDKYAKLLSWLPVFVVLIAILTSLIKHTAAVNITRQAVIAAILTAALTYYMRLSSDSFLMKVNANGIIFYSYLSSFLLLLAVPKPEIFSFWMIGGLLISMIIDNKLGLLIQFNMAFIMGITMDVQPKMILLNLVVCVLMCLLADALKNKATFIYGAVIILSTNVTLAYVVNNFVFKKIVDVSDYYFSFFSIFAVLVAAILIFMPYQKVLNKRNLSVDSQNQVFANIISSEEENADMEENKPNTQNDVPAALADSAEEKQEYPEPEIRTSYEVLCNLDNILLKRLREFSESLYEHSLKIGELSSRAAKEIGADEMLARAGGFYHEIGKLNGKQYIEEGIKLAEEYAFPKELVSILKEHNIKYDKPNSVEAAIVMLSDNVVSTIEYIEKTGDHKFTPNKIIENVFQMRMEKGTFDSSGISLKDFKTLKEFYQQEFGNEKEADL